VSGAGRHGALIKKGNRQLGGTMRVSLRLLTTAALVAGGISMVAPPAGATGPKLYQYSVHVTEQGTFTSSAKNSLCGTRETVTLNSTVNAHFGATQAGLSDEELLGLLDDDPDGVLRQVTYTETGTFLLETNGHTYSGTFTQWFGGGESGNSGQFVFTGTFSVRGTSELGTRLLVHFASHDLETHDTVKRSFEHGSVTGCLP
jgi:hypothetical protein